MKSRDIQRLLKEAGVGCADSHADSLHRFAELVEQHIRMTLMPKFMELGHTVEDAERRACAKICDEYAYRHGGETPEHNAATCAALIRARGRHGQ